MKVLLKKFTVLAAAFAMLFAVSSCSDPNGKANPDKKAGDSTTTATAADAASDAGSTSGGEQSTGGQSGGQSSGGGQSGGSGSGGQGTQTVTTVAVYEDINGRPFYVKFYSDNSFDISFTILGQPIIMMAGTYTGNPAQDGPTAITITKELSLTTHELESCTPIAQNLSITQGIFGIEQEDENGTNITYFIKKANEVESYVTFDETDENPILIDYIFYDNGIGRIFINGEIYSVVTYDGDPSNGNVDIHFKYSFATETGAMEPVNDNGTITIANNWFTGMDSTPAFRKIEEFRVTDSSADITDLGDSFKFYANGDFISTIIAEDGSDWPVLYGQWGIANSTPEGDGHLTLTVTYSNWNYVWTQKASPEVYNNIEIADFAFTFDGKLYTRQ